MTDKLRTIYISPKDTLVHNRGQDTEFLKQVEKKFSGKLKQTDVFRSLSHFGGFEKIELDFYNHKSMKNKKEKKRKEFTFRFQFFMAYRSLVELKINVPNLTRTQKVFLWRLIELNYRTLKSIDIEIMTDASEAIPLLLKDDTSLKLDWLKLEQYSSRDLFLLRKFANKWESKYIRLRKFDLDSYSHTELRYFITLLNSQQLSKDKFVLSELNKEVFVKLEVINKTYLDILKSICQQHYIIMKASN